MINKVDRNGNRKKRHYRVRNKISGTPSRPRLNIYRSGKHIYAQIIDDIAGKTLVSASTLEENHGLKSTSNKEAAAYVGKTVAERAVKEGINEVVFDRAGYLYHGRVKELADAAREAGLKF